VDSPALPEIPVISDFVPGLGTSGWNGIVAPKTTPPEVIEKLNKEINAILGDAKMKGRIADFGGTVLSGSPADFGKFMAEEAEKWGKVIKFASIKPGVRPKCLRRYSIVSIPQADHCCTAPYFFDPQPDWRFAKASVRHLPTDIAMAVCCSPFQSSRKHGRLP
jgi:hypothetical protein